MTLYVSVYFDRAYYIFGGYDTSGALSNIGRLDAVSRTWSLAGHLNQGRHAHGVIFDGGQFLVIGGRDNQKTESCFPNGETVTCIQQEGEGLSTYASYPELALVADDYGNDC